MLFTLLTLFKELVHDAYLNWTFKDLEHWKHNNITGGLQILIEFFCMFNISGFLLQKETQKQREVVS